MNPPDGPPDPAALREFGDSNVVSLEERKARAGDCLPPDPPFECVGYSDGVCWVICHSQELRGFTDKGLGRNGISMICGDRQDWLLQHYPRPKKPTKANPSPRPDGFRPEAVADAIIAACHRMGVWSPQHKVRGRGAWLGDDGELIVHLGDCLMINGRTAPCGRRGSCVYTVRDRLPRPARAAQPAGPGGPGHELVRHLESWNFRRGRLDRLLMLGAHAQSWLGGAFEFRSHVVVTGDRGTGKTTCLQAMHHMHGPSLVLVSDASPAGLWQTLGNDALPCALDEFENEPGSDRAQAQLRLMRQASSGAVVLRGGADHRSAEFVVRSPFVFASVTMPPLLPQDRSRLVQVDFQPLTRVAYSALGLPELGRRLFRRMIDRWPDLQGRALPLWRAALMRAGWDGRGADLYGTLLAGADVALHDATPADFLADLVAELEETRLAHLADEVPEWRRLLDHLAATVVDPYRRGERQPLGALMLSSAGYGWGAVAREDGIQDPADRSEGQAEAAAGEHDAVTAANALASLGVRIDYREFDDEPYERRWLLIANCHPALSEVFKGTRWQSPPGVTGAWKQTLLRCPGARQLPHVTRFRGVASRAVALPLSAALAGLVGPEPSEGVVDRQRQRFRPDEPTEPGSLH